MFLVSFEFSDFSSSTPHFYEDLHRLMVMRGFQPLSQPNHQTLDLQRATYAWVRAQDCAGEVRARARAVLSVLRAQARVVMTAVRTEEIEHLGLQYKPIGDLVMQQI
jgi:hypothetical protein